MSLLFCLLAANVIQTADQPQANQAKPAAQPPPVIVEAAALSKTGGTKGVMSIDPKMRAADLAQAFETLRREKTPAKVIFQLASGKTLSNIIDMTLMTNGSVILFRYNTPQGIQLQVVPVEEIISLYHVQ